MSALTEALGDLVAEAGGVDCLFEPDGYRHLGLTILDSVLSLRQRYSGTSRRLQRYCEAVPELEWTALDASGPEHDAARLVETLRALPVGAQTEIFGALKAPGTRRPRREVVEEVAANLLTMSPAVCTQDEFRQALETDYARVAARVMGIRGVGIAAWRYMMNLNGLQAAKPDTMVVRWVQRVLPAEEPPRSEQAIGALFESAVHRLRNLSRGLRHERGYLLWILASREGSLIQAVVGSRGGVGRRPRKRSGLAV